MRKFRRATIVTVAAGAVLVGGTAAWAAYSWTRHDDVTVVSAAATEPTVKVEGAITGLLPGRTQPLRVVIRNNNDFPVRVTKIGGGSKETVSGCAAWAVRVTPTGDSAYATTVASRSSRTVTVQVGMENWA